MNTSESKKDILELQPIGIGRVQSIKTSMDIYGRMLH
jgi:hypothetical protein